MIRYMSLQWLCAVSLSKNEAAKRKEREQWDSYRMTNGSNIRRPAL